MPTLNQYTPEERARALYYFFGWRGGTIHQLAKATGCDAQTLLYRQDFEHNASGWFAVRTCNAPHRRNVLAPNEQGNWPFWAEAIRGFWVTGPLDGLNDRYATNEAH